MNVKGNTSKQSSKNTEPLSDSQLITWFQNNYKDIEFINKPLEPEHHNRTEKLKRSIDSLDPDPKRPLNEQPKKVEDVWRNLFGKAIIYLKHQDNREGDKHDDEDIGVERLSKFFKSFKEFEPLLYGAEEARYRDHLSHVLSVYFTGEYFIREYLKGFDNISVGDDLLVSKGTQEKEGGDQQKGFVTPNEKEAMWCIMSLTHDLGIALEKMIEINPKAREMLKEFGIFNMQELSYPFITLPLDDFGIRIVSSSIQKFEDGVELKFINHVQSKYFLKFSEAYESRNHGMISCLVLLKNVVFFLETDYTYDKMKPLSKDDAKQFLIRRNILRSIAAHSNENIYHVYVLSFPFLLTFFDEIHEWGRPKFSSLKGEKQLDAKVTVYKLDKENVSYEILFKKPDGLSKYEEGQFYLEVLRYCIRKCEKFGRILRGAVDSNKREFVFTLEVKSDLLKGQYFNFTHQDPATLQIKWGEGKEKAKITNIDKLQKYQLKLGSYIKYIATP